LPTLKDLKERRERDGGVTVYTKKKQTSITQRFEKEVHGGEVVAFLVEENHKSIQSE
jgi:hypothetical protein